jgi:hypothetical protein
MKSLKERLLPPKPRIREGRVELGCELGEFFEHASFIKRDDFDSFYRTLEARIDALEAEAVRVYGNVFNEDDIYFGSTRVDVDTSTALLICIEPVEKPKPVSVAEIVSQLKHANALWGDEHNEFNELAERLEKYGVVKP